MKNADVQTGQAYVWASHKPTLDTKGTKVTALAVEMIRVPGDSPRSDGRRLTMVKVRWEEDRKTWFGGGRVIAAAGTEGHVPARELHGPYDEWAAVVDGYRSRKDEADRLKGEIESSMAALGITDAKAFGRVGVALGLSVEVKGAEDAQRLSDALAFAVAGRTS